MGFKWKPRLVYSEGLARDPFTAILISNCYHSIDAGSLGIGARRMRGLRVRERVEGGPVLCRQLTTEVQNSRTEPFSAALDSNELPMEKVSNSGAL